MKTYLTVITCLLTTAPLLRAEQQPEQANKVTYEDHVKPILRQHCFNCHHQGEKKGGLALDTYTSVMEGGGSGEIVYDDGDAAGSRLWQLVNHDDTPVMPPNSDKLPAEKLAVIRSWIDGGILENQGSKAKAKKKNALAAVVVTSGRPEGGGAMPETIPQRTPVVTDRAAAITAIAASPWAPLIAIAGQQQIVFYHADTDELLGILPFDEGIAQSLRFSRDGSYLIAAGGEHSVRGIVAIYDVKTGERVATVGDELDVVFGGDVNDNMNYVAMGGPQKMVRVYDATDGSKRFDLKKHTDWVYDVAFSPDGVLIASGDRSGGLVVWEAETGQIYLTLTDHKGAINAVAWRDDSNVLASASDDGTVKLWDMHSGKAIKSINAHSGGVTDVEFDHQSRLVTTGKDKRAKLWDASGNHIRDFAPLPEHVLEVAIIHDGSRVVYGDWTGSVLAAAAEDPTKQQPLAANPPPATERIATVKQRLDELTAQLQPLEQSLAAANQAVTAAQAPIDALNSQISAAKAAADKAAAAAAAADQQIAGLDQTLPSLTNASRDALDKVIASRVNLQADAAGAEAVATAEQALAEQLLDIAGKRRERIVAAQTLKTNTELAAAKRAEADQFTAQLPPLQQALEAAQQQLAAAQAARDQVAQALAAVKNRHEQLVALVSQPAEQPGS